MMTSSLERWGRLVLVVAFCGGAAFAQEPSTAPQERGPEFPAGAQVQTPPVATVLDGPDLAPGEVGPEVARPLEFWPDLNRPTLTWFAVVVILALTIRVRPLLSLRNLDGLVLAGMCLLLPLRAAAHTSTEGAYSWQWWAYLGLTVAAGYWLLRGVGLLLARHVTRPEGHVSSGALLVLGLAGLALCVHQIATAPVSAGSRDGIVGGLCTAATGKLPYGDATGQDSQSPLLYLVHAGAVRLTGPSAVLADDGTLKTLKWDNRDEWLTGAWWEAADLTAAGPVNALLFVALLAGLYVIGLRLHSAAAGLTMGAILCVFPGTLECLPQPDIMLPAVMLTWSVAFALLPAGALLAVLLLVLAGVAWPWAWLALPLMLAHFFRRGWQALGGLVGLAAGLVLVLIGTTQLTLPTLPRADGAYALADMPPTYSTSLDEQEQIVLVRSRADEEPRGAWTATLWRKLLAWDTTLNQSCHVEWGQTPARVVPPEGVAGEDVHFVHVDATGEARPRLQALYRERMSQSSAAQRFWAGARTILEATWQPSDPPPSAIAGTWEMWGGGPPMEGRWVLARRLVKLCVGLLVVWATLAILFGARARSRHIVGAFLLVTSGTLLASASGAATNLVWLLPLVLALGAVHEPPEEKPPDELGAKLQEFAAGGPAPRITLDN